MFKTNMAVDFGVRGLGLQDFMFFDKDWSGDLGCQCDNERFRVQVRSIRRPMFKSNMAVDFRVRGVGLQDFMFFDKDGPRDLGCQYDNGRSRV